MSEENELPRGWVEATLDDVTAPIRISVQPMEYPMLPFVGMEHVEAETMKLIGTVPASELKSNAVRFWPGDVLYGRLRPYLNKVLRPDFEGLCSAEFLVFRESPNLNSRYLQYFLNSWNFKEFASRLNEGDRPRVDWSQLKGFSFPLPPLPEQQRIVAAIEQQFSRLDAGVAALRRAQAKLKRYRAAVLKAAVEGKLTEVWRAEHPATEPATRLLERILAERRARWEADLRAKGKDAAKVRYVEPGKVDTEGLPEGWCWATIGQIAECLDHKRVPINKEERAKRVGTIPYYGANGQVGWIDDYIFDEPLVLVVEDETFLGRQIPFSYKITGKTWVNNHAHVLRPTSTVHVDYLNYSLVYYPFTPLTQGTTGRRKLTQKALVLAPFALPPLAEQEQIVAEVEQRLSVVSQLEATVAANLKRAERLRQSILKEAFAGRLVPQDASDEPAGVLLERVHRERDERKNGVVNRGRVVGVAEPVKIDVGETRQVELWSEV